MQAKSLPRGVIASVVVPFTDNGEIDESRLRAEVARLEASPVTGICVGGIYSGTAGASPDELHSLTSIVRSVSKKPLFALVFPDVTAEALEMTRAVADAGADITLVAQPHYLCQPASAGLVDMFADLRRAVSHPLLIADCFNEARVDIPTIETLIEKRLVDGVYQAADVHPLVDLLCLRVDVPIYSGIEDLHYVGFILGAHGAISDLGAVFPTELTDIYRHFENGNYDEARAHHERLVRLWRVMTPPVEREALLRAALKAQGRNVGNARSPYDSLRPEADRHLISALRDEGFAPAPLG